MLEYLYKLSCKCDIVIVYSQRDYVHLGIIFKKYILPEDIWQKKY